MSGFRSARARAHNHGASGVGTGAFFVERVTALALIPLGLWLAVELLLLSANGVTLAEARGWLASAVTGALMVVFFVIAMIHAYLAARVFLEDYVQPESLRLLAIVALAAAVTALAVVAVFSVLTIMFRA